MANRLHLDGEWPAQLTIRRGWAKATARPWNDDGPDAAIRLERGSSDFLRAVTDDVRRLCRGDVFSPALYPTATRVWEHAGFGEFTELEVMERPVGWNMTAPSHQVDVTSRPEWPALVAIDRLAFDGFWRMSEMGLVEALGATPRAAVIAANVDGETAGYALVGAQFSISFLQRVAVAPRFSGQGIGTSLVRASLQWAARFGVLNMVLNVRPENDRARRLYVREGFALTGTSLLLLRFEG